DLGGPESLHPPVPIRAGELGIKRELVKGGVGILVRSGLAQMETRLDGIRFWASENAEGFVGLLETEYARALSSRASWIVSHFADLSDADLREAMRIVSGHWAEEFERVRPPLNAVT
ncbi:MAG: ABC-three component system middle component 2, partial [Nocardioides sp.]